MQKQDIVTNSVRCLLCGDEIESKHRHDLVSCSCGNISVDGGQAYLRRVGGGEGQTVTWIETSILEKRDPVAFALAAVLRSQDGIGPAGDELDYAPVIDNWRFILMRDGLSLAGTVAGHPKVEDGSVITSTLRAIDIGEGWAKTKSRWYRLGRQAGDTTH